MMSTEETVSKQISSWSVVNLKIVHNQDQIPLYEMSRNSEKTSQSIEMSERY